VKIILIRAFKIKYRILIKDFGKLGINNFFYIKLVMFMYMTQI